MRLGNSINIRLSLEKQELYKAEAAIKELPLTTYIRKRLEAADDLITEISKLKRAMDYTNEIIKDSYEKPESSTTIEMLFLLRQMVQPQTIRLVQNELKRLGYEVWHGKEKNW